MLLASSAQVEASRFQNTIHPNPLYLDADTE